MSTTQTLKGFRDFLPETMVIRNRVINTLKQVFESYGFSELQTPTLEYAELLTGKYGEEAEKLMYLFKDQGGRDVGLKYDLTVPLARIMAQYPNLPKPFKRFQIQPAFRAENTQKSRYREFYQCDLDTVGSTSPLADAEILAVIQASLDALGFTNFTIRINSRPILFKITDSLSVLQSLDKLDKKTREEVERELSDKKISANDIKTVFSKIESAKPDDNLTEVISIAKSLGVTNLKFDPTLVRGLDYYTGTIFETVVDEPKIGSITGGGRYDNLIKSLGGPDLPAVGTTLGLDRICDCISELNLWPDLSLTPVRILVTIFSPEYSDKSLELSTKLRRAGIPTELYPDDRTKLEKQIQYAARKKIPYVAILGPDEDAKDVVTVKNLSTGKQRVFEINNLEIEKLIGNW